MWWIALVVVIIFIIVGGILLWNSGKPPSKDISLNDRPIIEPGSLQTAPLTNRAILDHFLAGASSNPLAGQNNFTNRVSLSRSNNPWIGSSCVSDVFDGEGAVCSNGVISATYYSLCDNGVPCQTGSVCLNGVCTPLSITELNGHPFQIKEDGQRSSGVRLPAKEDRAILYPSWQGLTNVIDVCSTPQIGVYLFICSINGKIVVWQGSDLLDGQVKPVQFPSNITSFKRMTLINSAMLPTMVAWLSDSDPKLMDLMNDTDLSWYLVLDLDKQLYLVSYSNQTYTLRSSDPVIFPLSIELTDFNSSNQAYLMISDTCSYLVTIRNGEVIAESFEAALAGAICGKDHLCLITDHQVNYYWRNNNGWEKFILNSQYKQVQFQRPWFIILLDYDGGVYKYQLFPSNGSSESNYDGASWVRHNIRSLKTLSLSNGADHVYAISGRIGLSNLVR